MKMLAVGRPQGEGDPMPAIARHARAEMTALWALYERGVVREMYSPGGPGAVLVMEVDSEEAARSALGELPLVTEGIIDFELIELLPMRALSMLFA